MGVALALAETIEEARAKSRRSAAQVWRAYRTLEKLNLTASLWHFSQYAIRGFFKYRQF